MIKVDLEIWMDPPRYTEMVKRTVHFEKFDELPKKGDQIELYDLEPAGRFEVDRINKAYTGRNGLRAIRAG